MVIDPKKLFITYFIKLKNFTVNTFLLMKVRKTVSV